MGGGVAPGCEVSRERSARYMPRHHHLAPYAALVLRGGYVEAGDRGRFRAEAGDVLLHDRFESHQDQFGPSGADILNLPLPASPRFTFGRLRDADAVARTAERDGNEAAALLAETLEPAFAAAEDWPDLLADALRAGEASDLGAWARAHGLLPSSVSRGFRRCYGVSPQRFRLELRAARAARDAMLGRERLAAVAAAAGFADQAHMCRTVKRLYGSAPSALARAQCVQDRGGARS